MQNYKYNYDNISPNFNEMCKYNNILPIDLNSQEIKRFFNYVEQSKKSYKLLLEYYLGTIYNFAFCVNDRITYAYENHNLAKIVKNYWIKQTQINVK